MKRFVFKLEAALRYRERLEDIRKREFAEVQGRFSRQEETIRKLVTERAQGLDELAAMTRGTLDLPVMMAQRRYLLGLERRAGRAREALDGLRAPLEAARLKLVDARKDVRVLDRLKERQLERHLQEANREEQKELDEIAQEVTRRNKEVS